MNELVASTSATQQQYLATDIVVIVDRHANENIGPTDSKSTFDSTLLNLENHANINQPKDTRGIYFLKQSTNYFFNNFM